MTNKIDHAAVAEVLANQIIRIRFIFYYFFDYFVF